MKEIVARWNEDYFGRKLSQACLEEFDQIDTQDRELVNFVDTFLFYWNMAGLEARNCSPLAARFLSRMAKSYMPSLWAKIPPITSEERLQIIDHVVQDVLGISADQDIRFLDIGCGYPPVTTIETSNACPKWTCVGTDPNFPASILFDADKAVGCFDEIGTLVYIQYLEGALQPSPEKVEQDKQRLTLEGQRIQSDNLLKNTLLEDEQFVVDPVKHYERDNLSFHTTTLLEFATDEPFDLIRCMNVFMYFDRNAILDNIKQAKMLLRDSGMFIFGNVIESGYASRYVVYQKCGTTLTPKLFGMDLGKLNQKDGNGWWAFHRDQPDTLFLAKVVRLVAENEELFGKVLEASDRVEQEFGYSFRDQDGYLKETVFLNTTKNNKSLSIAVADECGREITSFLRSMGLYAEITPFAHLVIDFSRSSPEHYEQYFSVF